MDFFTIVGSYDVRFTGVYGLSQLHGLHFTEKCKYTFNVLSTFCWPHLEIRFH